MNVALSLTGSSLLDLVSQMQIHPGLSICHPRYRPADLSPAVIARFQALAPALQRNYLRLHLRNYLYDIYYSGELQPLPSEEPATAPPLRNTTMRGVDTQFYTQLHRANRGTGYFDPGWQVVQPESGGGMAVQKDGLTVQILPARHLRATQRSAALGDTVAIRLPANRLETDYYMAIGNAGLVEDDQPLLELCFNLTADGAIAILPVVTTLLNQQGIPFCLKVLMHPDHYPRYDAGVLYLERNDYGRSQPLLAQAYGAVHRYLKPETPLFTKALAPGVGLAETPDLEAQEFGLHRCQIVADALLAAEARGDRSPDHRLAAIQQQFLTAGLDLQSPYLNPQSEDCYAPFSSLP